MSSSTDSVGGSRSEPTTLVVYCAGVHWDSVKGTDRNLVERLALHLPVLWVDPPRSLIDLVRPGSGHHRIRPLLRRESASVTRLSVVGPPVPSRRCIRRLTSLIMDRAIRWAVKRSGRKAAVVVTSSPEPRHTALPGVPYVYYATDDYVAGAALLGFSRSRMEQAEKIQLRAAALAMAVSPALLEGWRLPEGRGLLLPNGCDVGRFSDRTANPTRPAVQMRRPVAGLVGQLSSRIDLALLEAVVEAGISLLLVGPVLDLDETRFFRLVERPDVSWVGEQPYEKVGTYLASMDVGLTPYATSDFNRASFPLKTLEYLAAGLPVVSTCLPAVEWLGTSHVLTAETPSEYAAAVIRAAGSAHEPGAVEERFAFARQHSWEARAQQLLTSLERLGFNAPSLTGPAES